MNLPSKLGVYEILSPLGAGGMGEVYRARDPRLRRDVAVKILPADAVTDSERRKRFEQEAQAASALNHPNILVVHDFGEDNGIHYLVSELVQGESLRKLLQSGSLSIRKLLGIAVQISDGLAAAHQAGIVHRDLKPENIMVTPENRVKILDFGLAKLAQTGTEEAETVSHVLSQSAVIRGTIPYMSPEQAAGKTIDFRSDQFSFGLILYEMATGRRAFQKDTGVQVLSAIISEEPAPISSLNAATPAPLRWIIERCLNKDPRQRYDSTADLYRELQNLKDHLSEATVTAETISAVPLRSSLWKRLTFVVLSFLATISVVAFFFINGNTNDDLSSYQFTRLLSGTRATFPPAWSPDSKSIAFVSEVDGLFQVFTKDLESLVSNQITNAKHGCFRPVWSADGSRIYYTAGGDLWAVSAAGGPSEKILENVEFPWLSMKNNAVIFRRTQNGKHSVWISSPPGTEPQKYPSLPPGTQRIYDGTIKLNEGSEISLWADAEKDIGFWILPYPSGKPRRVKLPPEILHPSPYSWMPDNQHLVFGGTPTGFGKTNLRMVKINDDTSRPLTAGYASPEASPSVSPDGQKIAFTTVEFKADLTEIPLDGSRSKHLPTDAFAAASPIWSPGGTQYAFAGISQGIFGVWLRSVADQWTRPVVTERELKAIHFDSPSFSPDGQRIAYQIRGDGGNEVWVSPVSGGKPIRFISAEYTPDFPSWSPDGNWISFYSESKNALAKVLATGSGVPVIIKKDLNYFPTRWSPTGEWITYITPQGLFLISPDGKTDRLLTAGNWGSHAWSADGSTIYGVKFEGQRVFVCSVDLATGTMKTLNELERRESAQYLGFSLSPDNSSVITSEVRFYGTIWLLEGFAKPVGFFERFFRR
jgi:serine/threonine protein kinase/Tol biopolymer transport system component